MLLFIAILAALIIFIILYVLVTTKSSSEILIKSRLRIMGLGSAEKKPADMYWHEQMNRSLYERLVKPAIDGFVKKLPKWHPPHCARRPKSLWSIVAAFMAWALMALC